MELDANCAEAHAALGWAAAAYDWDWVTAEAGLRRALELKPQLGRLTSGTWISSGRWDATRSPLPRASERSMESMGLVLNLHLGWHHLYSRDYSQAMEQLLKTLELDQNFILTRMFLGEAYELCGRFNEAIDEFEKAVSLSQRAPTYVGGLGHAYALSGHVDKALHTIEELRQLAPHTHVSARVIAEIFIGLGDTEKAFEWLERAVRQRNGWLIHLKENPRYDGLRGDPRFEALVPPRQPRVVRAKLAI